MKLNDKARTALSEVARMFETGDIPETIAIVVFPRLNVPSARYSLLNRLLLAAGGTADARGIRTWNQAGRRVKKGSKAIWIFAPIVHRIHREASEEDQESTEQIIRGFRLVPVFRVEDTEGEPVENVKLELPPPPPLKDVAERLGVSVRYVPSGKDWYGCYVPGLESIQLATPEETVFWHELAHAAHHRIDGLKGGQDPFQEIVAELSAIVLARLFGRKLNGRSFQYVSHYAETAGKNPAEAVLWVLGKVEKVLDLILEETETPAAVTAA